MNSVRVTIIGIIALGAVLSVCPVTLAQKTNDNKGQYGRTQIAEIAKSAVGILVFEAVSVKEPIWQLFDAVYLERHDRNKAATVSMSFKNGKSQLSIDIAEYDSADVAEKRFDSPREYGGSVPYKAFGDRGEAVTGEKGEFLALRFRQGRFFVSIYNSDAKAVGRFASYISESINKLPAK